MRSATPGPKSLSIFRIPRKKNGPCTHPPTAAQRPVRAKSKDDGKLNGKHEAGEEGEGEQEKKGNGEGGRAEGGEREEEEVAEGKDTRCSKYCAHTSPENQQQQKINSNDKKKNEEDDEATTEKSKSII
eukprot:GHVT01064909.1.p2 GENE.GHVT01064909.1~~GHVT01064909.1.p2  ORF type:complete len:129 (+),score=36.12 GHVT01064909.1:1731-2117(+)